MKKEVFNKLELSFQALGVSMKQAADAMKALSTPFKYQRELEIKLAHRRRCLVIAFAMSKASNYKSKRILWNLFLNT